MTSAISVRDHIPRRGNDSTCVFFFCDSGVKKAHFLLASVSEENSPKLHRSRIINIRYDIHRSRRRRVRDVQLPFLKPYRHIADSILSLLLLPILINYHRYINDGEEKKEILMYKEGNMCLTCLSILCAFFNTFE